MSARKSSDEQLRAGLILPDMIATAETGHIFQLNFTLK